MKCFLFYDSVLLLIANTAKIPRIIVAIIIPHSFRVGIITVVPSVPPPPGSGVGVANGWQVSLWSISP